MEDVSTLNNFLSKIYPVGSIYMSEKNTSPASFLEEVGVRFKNVFCMQLRLLELIKIKSPYGLLVSIWG